MRIVDTDSFGGDYPNEQFVLRSMPERYAQRIADVLNEMGGPDRYYKVVAEDYVLQPGFEP